MISHYLNAKGNMPIFIVDVANAIIEDKTGLRSTSESSPILLIFFVRGDKHCGFVLSFDNIVIYLAPVNGIRRLDPQLLRCLGV